MEVGEMDSRWLRESLLQARRPRLPGSIVFGPAEIAERQQQTLVFDQPRNRRTRQETEQMGCVAARIALP